ncbi:MAG: MBL fold metallo-hydrolase [Alphaproteobacteria bacterium]|nr:MBL fold metallo-hydrolase [Alphaproteobacteria bacterium]
MRVTVLGCGGSGGVPLVGGVWGNCDPAEPRNRRRRVSILVEQGGTTLVVDTSPDFREQMLDAGVRRLDAVLFTHAHADHVHGIDDLRAVNRMIGRPIPVHGDAATLRELRQRFGYAFRPLEAGTTHFYKPTLEPHEIAGPFRIGAVEVVPFVQDHGYSTTLGFRFGRVAYSTDVVRLDETAFAVLAGVDTWIVDCLREEPHPTHSHLVQTLGWIARVRPRRAVLTHMTELLDYASLCARLPSGVEPGYDGLVIQE